MGEKQVLSFKCHKISGGTGEGRVLISMDDICFYLAHPDTGNVMEKDHALEGRSVANKILIFPAGKGSSVAQGAGLHNLTKKGTAPKAMIVRNPDPVLVAGAVIWNIPLVDRVEEKFFQNVQNDSYVKVNADQGLITLIKED